MLNITNYGAYSRNAWASSVAREVETEQQELHRIFIQELRNNRMLRDYAYFEGPYDNIHSYSDAELLNLYEEFLCFFGVQDEPELVWF